MNEDADMWRLHAQAFDAFLNELYAIMVDPCATGTIKREDMMQALKNAAVRDREAAGARSAVAARTLPWAHPVRADLARGYIVDANDNYVCLLRASRSDEYNQEIAKALNAYAPQSASAAWIPVGERVPARGSTALVRHTDGELSVADIADLNDDERGFFVRGSFFTWDHASHWMPLPSAATNSRAEPK